MRICRFCDLRATTAEHAWPKWALDLLGPSATIETWLGPDASPRTWRGRGTRVKHLCAGCNNGWMSDLENRSKALVGALMSDISMRVDRVGQDLITVWAVKTAMVFECTNPAKRSFYTRAERERLRTALEAPADTLVWLGRQERSSLAWCEARRLFASHPPGNTILSDGYVTTLAISRLVIQILTVRRAPGGEGVRVALLSNEPALGDLSGRFRYSD